MFDAAAYMKNRREQRRNYLIGLAGGKCIKCRRTDNLNFDHRDPRTKLFELSGWGLDKSMELILIEFAKCDLLCEDCHIEKTRTNGDHGKITGSARFFLHGTARNYLEQGCRCERCKNARREHRAGLLGYNDLYFE